MATPVGWSDIDSDEPIMNTPGPSMAAPPVQTPAYIVDQSGDEVRYRLRRSMVRMLARPLPRSRLYYQQSSLDWNRSYLTQ